VTAAPNVVAIGSRGTRRVDFKAIAVQRLKKARENLALDRAGFAAALTERVGWRVTEAAVTGWERGATPPGDVLLAAEQGTLVAPPGTLLGVVPQSFPAAALEGWYVTSYQFTHGGKPQHHADIARITAESDRHLSGVTGAARTEGRAVPFRNEIEACLASRHVVGTWKNTSDARYFGNVHLAVLPGEMVMDGWYTGFASDITVSIGHWRWVRLDAEPETGVVLAQPATVHDLVMNRSEYDGPLTIADIGGA
jgi:hypothetical protein